jgi:hypothetical protein
VPRDRASLTHSTCPPSILPGSWHGARVVNATVTHCYWERVRGGAFRAQVWGRSLRRAPYAGYAPGVPPWPQPTSAIVLKYADLTALCGNMRYDHAFTERAHLRRE